MRMPKVPTQNACGDGGSPRRFVNLRWGSQKLQHSQVITSCLWPNVLGVKLALLTAYQVLWMLSIKKSLIFGQVCYVE